MAKLQLTALGKRCGEVAAVSGADLSLAAGRFASLLGPSACGTTTPLRMIAGFILPSEGSIAMDGAALSTAAGAVPPEKRRMSMIFQSYAIWPNMTVAENVAFGLKLRKLSRGEIAAKAERILGLVQLAPLKHRYPAALSRAQ